MIKTNKNSGVNFKLVKIILAIAVGVVCFYQINKLNFNAINTITSIHYLPLLFVLILVLPNYWTEYKKWEIILRSVDRNVSVATKIQSFFAGIITGMITPNMQGNFIGRIYYFPRKMRLSITLLTLTANLGQFCVTIILGIGALLLIGTNHMYVWLLPSLLVIITLIFYFRFENITFFREKFKWYKQIRELLQQHHSLRPNILLLSLIRHFIFSLQFLLALHAFGAEMNWHTYCLIWELYLWTTLSPSLIFGKLFVRESIALWVFAGISLPEWNIVAASFSIWVINLLLPTLIGLFICKKQIK